MKCNVKAFVGIGAERGINLRTPQDFIDEDLPLFYCALPRAVVQLFKQRKTSSTARLIFDYLMFNFSKKLQHTHKVELTEIAAWLEMKQRAVYNGLAHLLSIGAISKHPDKIDVYRIPALDALRNELHEYRLAVRENTLQNRILERIKEMEFDMDRELTDNEKRQIAASERRDQAYKDRQAKRKKKIEADFFEDQDDFFEKKGIPF